MSLYSRWMLVYTHDMTVYEVMYEVVYEMVYEMVNELTWDKTDD